MPNKEQIDRAIKLISKSAVNYEYFFAKLNDPEWIKPLKEHDLFKDPPQAVKNESGAIVGAERWPQSEFLKRVAANAPEEVLQVALEIKTDNHFIISDLTEAAFVMPGDYAEKWANKLYRWIEEENNIYRILENRAGTLISHLVKQGKTRIALRLAGSLLAVLPDPEAKTKIHPRNQGENVLFSSLEPSIRMEQHDYGEILKENITDLAKAAPFETMEMLCGLLEKAIIYSLHDGEKQKPKDLTWISRPAIEDHEQNHGHRVDDILITAVRDIGETICKEQVKETVKVFKFLESYGWDIFKRIGLYLLWVINETPFELIQDRLLNKELFNSLEMQHEYYRLLTKYFGQLSPEAQSLIFSWIEEAEEEIRYLENKEFSKEQKEKRLRWWQYEKLIIIQNYLTGEWERRFLHYKKELGEPRIPPGFHSWISGGWTGSLSPIKPEELSKMTIGEQLDYLMSWKPSGDWEAPTPDGLGSSLSSLVAENPEKYMAEIERFMDRKLDPTYIRHIISGFSAVIENNKPIEYKNLFKLCKWVVDQPREIIGRKIPKGLREDFEMDLDWRHTRDRIASLFEKIFNRKAGLPYSLREIIWQIIEPLTNDPDPDLEYEIKYGGENMNPLTLSWNSIRGKALHGVMHYAMWVYNELKEKDKISINFKEIPEVLTVLKDHLEIPNNPFAMNQTDRAVYGMWLPQLVLLDSAWVKENLVRIFPADLENRRLREAAWDTYLLYSRLYDQVYDVIKSIYCAEVDRLANKKDDDKTYRTPEGKLSEHLVIFYIREKISLVKEDLISLFFEQASVDLTTHTMNFIGRSLNREKSLEPQLVEKFKTLWDWRIEKKGGIENISEKELAAFGSWFASGLCGENWTFPYLEGVLQRTTLKESKVDVFEHMSHVFKNYPEQSLRCLNLFIDKNDDPWFFLHRKREGVWRILEQGLAHEVSKIREEAENIVHLLGSKGYLEYRDLLNRSPKPSKNV